jgi:hypothetical protein
MLLKSVDKLCSDQFVVHSRYNIFLMLLLLLCPSHGFAQENKWQWHGFIAQGVIDVNGSDFVNDDEKLSFELTEIGMNTAYQINDDFRFAVQGVYLDGGNRYPDGARIDYLLIDWTIYSSAMWRANLFLGRFKNNHWLYSSTRDVPFTRPSVILPQSIYFDGFRDIAEGGEGTAIKISHNHEKFGDFDFNASYGTSEISQAQTKLVLSEFAFGEVKQEFDLQVSLYWQPIFSSWRFGLSLLDSDFLYRSSAMENFSDAIFSFQFYTINAQYEGEKWQFSSEIFQGSFALDGFYSNDFTNQNFQQGAYIQAQYRMDSSVELMARYETFYGNKDDKNGEKLFQMSFGTIPDYFAYQHDLTLGASYRIMPHLEVKLEHHWVEGTGRLTPVVVPNIQLNNNKNWQISAVQFTYWF